MKIFINGQPFTLLNEVATVSDALQEFLTLDQLMQSYAAALNSNFVGKDNYQETVLNEGDSIDVLFPIQGG